MLAKDAVLATTTSSLSVSELAEASGRPERFVGFHVFNPVPAMPLVEIVAGPQTSEDTRVRAHALVHVLGKTPVDVPDLPGFVVNRLLFPYLFSAVRLLEETGLDPNEVDQCMKLGAGHPLGPLALLDLVGLDVAVAIGESIGTDVPERVRTLVGRGRPGAQVGPGLSLVRRGPEQILNFGLSELETSLRYFLSDVPHSRTSSHSEDRPAPPRAGLL